MQLPQQEDFLRGCALKIVGTQSDCLHTVPVSALNTMPVADRLVRLPSLVVLPVVSVQSIVKYIQDVPLVDWDVACRAAQIRGGVNLVCAGSACSIRIGSILPSEWARRMLWAENGVAPEVFNIPIHPFVIVAKSRVHAIDQVPLHLYIEVIERV